MWVKTSWTKIKRNFINEQMGGPALLSAGFFELRDLAPVNKKYSQKTHVSPKADGRLNNRGAVREFHLEDALPVSCIYEVQAVKLV